jgi:exonuclease SbcC
MRAGLLSLAALALLARPLAAAAPLALEREVARLAGERDALVAETRRVQAEAAALAEPLASPQARAAATRADAETARRLRAFDRVAERLDALDRDVADRTRRLERARAAFEAAAATEERRLEEVARERGASAAAADQSALDAARRRVAALVSAGTFRPPLDVVIDPLDGPAELETKLALLDGERKRLDARLDDLHAEESLLAARLAARREWARALAAARRDAAGGVELVDRSYEEAQAALSDLTRRASALAGERQGLEEARKTLETRRAQAGRRLEELRKAR